MPKKLKITIFAPILIFLGLNLLSVMPVYARVDPTAGGTSTTAAPPAATPVKSQSNLGNGCVGQTPSTCVKNNKIVKWVNVIVNFLAGLVGIVVAGSIIFAGIQYTLAEDNPQKVSAARDRIVKSITALLVFLFIYAILQWLIPGGVFS